jgi:plastocyanin
MKKIITALALITLLGAGCAKTPAPTSQTASESTPPVTIGNESITIETVGGDETKTQSKPIAINTGEKDADGIPIIDVTLGSENTVRTIDLKVGNYSFEPNVITAKPGEKIRVDFRGVVGTHTILIDASNVKMDIKDGSGFIFFAPTKPGSYPIYCDVGEHRTKGMEGTLIVK